MELTCISMVYRLRCIPSRMVNYAIVNKSRLITRVKPEGKRNFNNHGKSCFQRDTEPNTRGFNLPVSGWKIIFGVRNMYMF